MSLVSGTKLGPYEILSPLGAGGMGEVYRARDTRLERTVAVKVLPTHMASSPEVRHRFEREAKTISQLSHPHICALYDVGREGEIEYLVMELLEGETLSDRLSKGALPLEQTLRYGIEIADAMDKAHRQGIVHRDLKPGNVMLTKSGVKLLDFGLAKATAPARGPQLTSLPTQASPVTQAGTVLGTFQYMSPEQLEGKEADGRSDIFAFGAVLYEMATGRKAFSGASQASLISAILRDDPKPVSSVQSMTPLALDRVVQSCLAKDPEERWQSAGDLRKELHWIAQGGAAAQAPVSQRAGKKRERLAWAAAAIVGAGLAAALLLHSRTPPVAFDRAIQFKVSLPESVVSSELDPVKTLFALSPDGSALAFLGSTAATRQIYVRSLDAIDSRAVPGTQGAESPFWSPDGRNLAFFSDGKLKRVDLSGGPAITICDAPNGAAGTWSPDGAILFSTWGAGSPVLHEVAAAGGASTDATKLDSMRHEHWQTWPMFLPDGKHFLYVSEAGNPWPNDQRQIWLGELGSKTVRFVAPTESRFGYSPTGHLLFTREGALFAQAFDADRALFRGEPFAVAPEILTYAPTFAAGFAVAEHAPVLAFKERPATRLTWVARSGKELGPVRPDASYTSPRFSPAGDRLAFAQLDPRLGTYDIWIEDMKRATTARATFEPVSEAAPVWFPDGRRIVYCADVGGNVPDLFWLDPADGKNGLLLHSDGVKFPSDISPDGRFLLYTELVSKQAVIWVLPLTDKKKPFRFLTDPFSESAPRFSPDGRFVAYVATESGRPEVYVRPFPGPGTAWQVSRTGGKAPRWSRDGREIFFLSEHAVMSASVRTNRGFESDAPTSLFAADLFEGDDTFDYEIAPDGRFLVLQPVAGRDSGIRVIANWLSGIKK
jgi:Tol biopolymer transport system component